MQLQSSFSKTFIKPIIFSTVLLSNTSYNTLPANQDNLNAVDITLNNYLSFYNENTSTNDFIGADSKIILNFKVKAKTRETSSALDKVKDELLKFKDFVQNEDQFYLAKYINELRQKKERVSFLKNAPTNLSEFELSEFVSAIFLSDVDVFNIEIKNLLISCVEKYPNTELSDIANGYLELYANEYEKIK